MSDLIIGNGCQRDAAADADIFSSIFGPGTVILNVGKKMIAEIHDNNTVRVYDGACSRGGMVVRVAPSTYEDFSIPTGSQGVTTVYYIGFKVSTGGDNSHSAAKVVSVDRSADGSIRDGSSEMYLWLYKATVSGLVLSKVEALASVVTINTSAATHDSVSIDGTGSTDTPTTPDVPVEEGLGRYRCTASSLAVRKSGSASAKEIGYLHKGDTYTVWERSGNWYRIDFKGAVGWVSAGYMEKV